MALDTELFEKIKIFTQYHILQEDLMSYEEFSEQVKENIEADGIHLTGCQDIFKDHDILILFCYMNYLIVEKIERSTKEMIYLKPSLEETADRRMILQ